MSDEWAERQREKSSLAPLAFRILGVALALNLLLLLTDYRILITETFLEGNQPFPKQIAKDWGEFTGNSTLVCGYFTGRSVRYRVYNFSPNNFLGKDSCPFITKPE